MGKTGSRYSPEFKQVTVQLLQASDEEHPVPKIARDLGVRTETLRKWVNQAQIAAGGFPKRTCQACPLRERCTKSKSGGRSVSVYPDERLLAELRERQRTPAGRKKLR